MLELKPFEDWSAASPIADPTEKIKGYADYVRTSYFKANQLTDEVEQGILGGVRDAAVSNGLIAEDAPDEEQQQFVTQLVAPKPAAEKEARFLLDHYALDFDANGTDPESVAAAEKAATLRKYFAMKQANPAALGTVEPLVADMVGDSESVRRARRAAVDRGDMQLVAVTEDDGRRQVYTGSGTNPESVNGKLDSLLSAGAIDADDLRQVNGLIAPVNGGKAYAADIVSQQTFSQTLDSLAKNDPELKEALGTAISDFSRSQRKNAMTGGEQVVEGALAVVASPFIALGEIGGAAVDALTGKEKAPTPKRVKDLLFQNKAFLDKGYSQQDIERFTSDYVLSRSGPAYRADKPESGITTDSLGNPVLAQALVANKDQFDLALNASGLNDDQKRVATADRIDMLEAQTPALKRLIVENDDDAASAYAQAKATGMSDSAFVEKWVAEKGTNYSGFSERLQQFGSGIGNTIASIPLGVGALFGSEQSTKALVAMNKDKTDRQEYSRLMGDEYGLGFQILEAVPQVATDILLTAGSGGAFVALKTAARGGARGVALAAAKNAASFADEATAAAIKSASKIGNEAQMISALKGLGVDVATKVGAVGANAPLFATTFTRSASSNYVSIYSQLPETMSHEEKHKSALGYAVGSGLSTAAVTLGMSFLGRGGVEDLSTRIFKPLRAGDDAAAAAGTKVVPLDKLNYKQAKLAHEAINNAGRSITDAQFKSVMRIEIGGAYKNYLRSSFKGFLDEGTEEAIDQAITMKIEDAALDRDTPIAEKVDQIWHSFVIGGVLGGASPAVTQLASPLQFSERVEALQASVDYSKKISSSLRAGGSPATAEIFERNIQQQVAELATEKTREIAAQQRAEDRKKTDTDGFVGDTALDLEDDEAAAPSVPLLTYSGEEPPVEVAPAETAKPKANKSGLVVGDLVGDRVFINGLSGRLERTEDGVFRLALDTPLDGGVTHMTVGASPFQSIEKVGIRRKTPLMVLGSDAGDIAAGTPYVVPNKAKKNRFALPSSPDGFEFSEIDGEEVLTVKGARLVGNSLVTTNLHITDPDQINNITKHFSLKRPEGAATETQLNLDLFGDMGAPAAETGTVAEPAAKPAKPATEVDPQLIGLEEQTDIDSEIEEELDRLEVDEALSILNPEDATVIAITRIAVGGKADPQAIRAAAGTITPEQLAGFYAKVSALETQATGLPDEKSAVRTRILENAASMRLLADMVRDAELPDIVRGKKVAATVDPSVDLEVEFNGEKQLVSQLRERLATAESTISELGEGNAPAALVSLVSDLKSAVAGALEVKPTPAPTAKKPRAPRAPRKTAVPVAPLADVTVADSEPDPKDEIFALREEAEGLNDPEITMGGQTFPLSQVREALAETQRITENRSKIGVPPSDKTLTQIRKMETLIRTTEERSALRLNEIEEQIALIENPNQVLESEQTLADALKAIETGRKPATQKQQKNNKTPTYRHSMAEVGGPPVVDGFEFRVPSEAEAVTDWIDGGFLITDLRERGGFNSKKEGEKGVSLDYAPKGEAPYSLRVKQYLLAKVQEKFPFVPVLEGTGTMDSKLLFAPMDAKGERKHIKLPVVRDGDGKAIEGIFTNDPRVTAAQLDLGLLVVVPPDFIDRLNPSISKEPDGRVSLVRLWPDHEGVSQAGGLSQVGTTTWTPTRLGKDHALNALIADPAPDFLPEAPELKGKVTFARVMNDAINSLMPNGPAELESPRGKQTAMVRSIINKKRVNKENAEVVALSSAVQFSLELKQQPKWLPSLPLFSSPLNSSNSRSGCPLFRCSVLP